ncbi:uncharacterized protein LOC135461554 [Liolophura sinensis]|uniref:uncharacterized protein LOC135461554 n=1 Tax=Liolophura sinensis TaxID=3198878 RepID=UPI003158B3FB
MGDGFKGEDATGCRVPACPPGFIKHLDGCYSFKETPKTFSDARKQCQSEGGDLASLINDRDIEFVTQQMILLGLTGQFWIGYTDAKMDGIYVWVDDSASDFQNWAEGEPKEEGKATRDCVAMGDTSEYKFTTHSCELQANFVCRKPLQLTACPRGWYMYEGECYHYFQFELSFIEAYLTCIVHAADLSSILSEDEEDFIYEDLLADVNGTAKMWIGAVQGFPDSSAGTFAWTDGEQLDYTNWAEGQPLYQGSPRCVFLNEKMEWNAVVCDTKYNYICKRNQKVKERCPEGSIRIGLNCYKVILKPEPQPDAEEDCRKMGGGLVSIHSQYEQYVIGRYLDSQTEILNPWIGFVERGVDGEYSWSDKSEVNYKNWGNKQPSDKVDKNNCVLMVKHDNYQWNDQNCEQELPYLCEYRNTPCVFDDVCHENAQCSFGQCRCKKGFMGDGRDACADIDECSEGDPCPDGAKCVNRDGGYECECQPGFVRSGDQCISLTKCKTDADCNTLGECKNGNCQCQKGYKGDGKQTCEDVNECEEETSECNPNADCQNKRGGYDCVCKDGYMGDGIACIGLPRNCDEVRLQNPESKSGSYKIDPDGPGGIPPFTVACVIRPDIGITVIPSNSQSPKAVKSPEPEKKVVKYRKTDEQIAAVIDVSEFCYQNVLYKCSNGAKLQGVGSWTNKDNADKPFDKCYCGMLGTCANPGSQCNCDGTPMRDQVDETKIIDKTQLPVKAFTVGGVNKGQKAASSVGPLMCGPKQFDIPLDCDDALRNYGQKRNGPQLIDVDGPDGDEAGNLEPFVADCDMTSYPSTGVTIIPNTLPEENKPDTPGEIPVEYPVKPEAVKKLTETSKFCSQEMSYTCTNSGLMGKDSFWSGTDKKKRTYWAGGLGQEKMCGCGVTKSCEDPKVNCNCDIADGKERKDFGLIINKADLPVGSVTLKEVGGDKKGSLSVGPLMCGQNQFGIEPTCQQYREKGYTDDYTYLIDPDGPPRRADEPIVSTDSGGGNNLAPFPVICEMIDDKPVGITTVGHDSEKPTKVDDAEEPGSYTKPVTYNEASPEQLAALADHSSYCTQEMAYKCKQAVIHNIDDPKNPIAYWIGRDGKKLQYFAGVGGSMCQCGIEGNCEGKDVVCNCDADLPKEVVDKGFLSNKDDLPVLKLAFGDTGDDANDLGEHTLGKLRCFEVFETCYHMQQFYKKRPHNDMPPNGRYMIDPDGPQGQDPFEVYCHFPRTIVDIEAGNYYALPDVPENRGPGAQCFKPQYANANKEQLEALTEKSGFCRQFGKFTCQHASLTKNAFWKSSNGEKQQGWAGNAGGDKCACGEVGKCQGGGACNCDISDQDRRQDQGLFIEKKLLPVSEICFGLDEKDVPESETRFAEYFLGSLECSNTQFGIPKDCQDLRNSKTPGEPIFSEPWLIDPDQLGPLPPFPVYCEMLKGPPIGITVIEPKAEKPEEIPAAGKDIPVEYKSSTTEQLRALTEVSEYCTQEMSYICKDAALKLGGEFGAYSREGQALPYWAGNSGGKDGCKGGKCQCDKTDGKEYTDGGSLLDKKVLPISRINIAATQKGTRKLKVEDLRCFALFKTCHEIKVAGQDKNPNWDGRYGIDPDGPGGVEPFSVDCDFRTNPEIGITEIPSDAEEDIPVGEKALKQPVSYNEVTPEQAHELAQASEFCLQGMKYKCKKAALMGAGGAFLGYDGKESTKFAGADNGDKDGCACVVLGTCPDKKKCRCDAVGPMEAEEGDFVTNRDILPVTGVKSDGVTEEGAEASFSVGNLRCGPKPFDLPEDCQQALDWGYKTGEALIWPGREVDPFLVMCDMDTNPGKGITIVPTNVEDAPVIGVTDIPVKYDGASPEQIKALVDESEKCLLPMKYDCSATKFSNAFSMVTPEKEDVKFFAAGRNSGMCNCGDQKRCWGR